MNSEFHLGISIEPNFHLQIDTNSENHLLSYTTPVSYTHLDVYKRQALYRGNKS